MQFQLQSAENFLSHAMPNVSPELDYLAVLQIHGDDAVPFLQGQLTADLRHLSETTPLFACVCNPKGRVIGLLLLTLSSSDNLLAVCSRELAAAIESHLSRYVLRSRVKFSRREDLAVFGLAEGVEIEQAAQTIDHTAGRYALVPRSLAVAMGTELTQNCVSVESWRAGEMMRGVQWLGETTSGAFLPQMLGLQAIGALSFTKGCYPGQEVIARTRHLGKLKRHPLLCRIPGDAPTLAPMEDVVVRSLTGEATAVVVDSTHQGEDETLVMLVARTGGEFIAEALAHADTVSPVSWSAVPGP
jgi:folate-binding protein YgfZ